MLLHKESRIDAIAPCTRSQVGLSSCTSKPTFEKNSSRAAKRTPKKHIRSNTAPLDSHPSRNHLLTKRHHVMRGRTLSDKSSSGDSCHNSPNDKQGGSKEQHQPITMPADKLLGVEFHSLNESDKIKRVRVVAEKVMRVRERRRRKAKRLCVCVCVCA